MKRPLWFWEQRQRMLLSVFHTSLWQPITTSSHRLGPPGASPCLIALLTIPPLSLAIGPNVSLQPTFSQGSSVGFLSRHQWKGGGHSALIRTMWCDTPALRESKWFQQSPKPSSSMYLSGVPCAVPIFLNKLPFWSKIIGLCVCHTWKGSVLIRQSESQVIDYCDHIIPLLWVQTLWTTFWL